MTVSRLECYLFWMNFRKVESSAIEWLVQISKRMRFPPMSGSFHIQLSAQSEFARQRFIEQIQIVLQGAGFLRFAPALH